jgi:hypothetical protein
MIGFLFFSSEFSREALIDIERFQQQKILDLRETLAGYVFLQIKMCRKVWQSVSLLLYGVFPEHCCVIVKDWKLFSNG